MAIAGKSCDKPPSQMSVGRTIMIQGGKIFHSVSCQDTVRTRPMVYLRCSELDSTCTCPRTFNSMISILGWRLRT